MSGFISGDEKESVFSESKEGRQAVVPGKPLSAGGGRSAAVHALEPTDFQGEGMHLQREQPAGLARDGRCLSTYMCAGCMD